ncbi:acyltransferase family protein [Bradyrhizobium sp.]|uniref:acyltransferase family protein n=1 Tax=Bradyrhizobium sp. TaxID=376 RepID=UPI003C60544A
MTSNGTTAVVQTSGPARSGRVDWVDYAKGICIIMVVMMHSVLGVELAAGQTGFMHLVVAFAKPFRMPDFFLISGLFLPLVIDRDWRIYLDRKVVHFAYFYVLWVTIQFGFKAPSFAAETSWAHAGYLYLESFIEPFGTLWFIYELPIFFVVTKATRRLPPLLIWGLVAILEMTHYSTGWTAIDEFGARFVYFYAGYLFADRVFALSDRARAEPRLALAALALWALVDESLVQLGMSEWPLISLSLGVAGACAIVTTGTLLARAKWLDFVRFCGEHSIVIYLAFFLPMAATRTLLLHTGLIHDVGVMSLTVTLVALFGALAIWQAAIRFGANFLFERPDAFWIAPRKAPAALQAAE